MPLDAYAHLNGLPQGRNGFPETLAELRLQLIGNRELKIRALQEPQFVNWLLHQLQEDLEKVESTKDLPAPELAQDIHDKVVILRILACFVADVQGSDDKVNVDSSSLQGAVPLISMLFQYVTEVFLPVTGQNSSRLPSEAGKVKSDIHKSICDALWIIVVFANADALSLDQKCYENLWKLTTTLLICDDSTIPMVSSKSKNAVVSSLHTLPLLLKEAPRELSRTYAPSLLRLCLTRLQKEFAMLHRHYVSGLPTVGNFLEKVSPNIIADKKILRDIIEVDFITSLVVTTAQLLNYTKEKSIALPLESPFFTSKEVFLCMVLLLKCDGCHHLNIATLNLIHFYLNALEDSGTASEEIVFATYEKLFPRIIELLDSDLDKKHSVPPYLNLPVSVLSGLCLKYPRMSLHLHNTNVDTKIMKDLQDLVRKTPMFASIFRLKVASKEKSKLADFTSLSKHRNAGQASYDVAVQISRMEQIADYLQSLSVYSSSNEDYRRRVTKFSDSKSSKSQGPNFLCLLLFELMDNYRFLIQQLLLSYDVMGKLLRNSAKQDQTKVFDWFGKNLGMIYTLIEHPIFTQTVYLVRSLSRSITTLRTFFVDCNSIKSVFDVDDDTTLSSLDQSNLNEDIIEIVRSRYNREASFKRRGTFVSSLLEVLGQLDNVKYAMQYFTKANPGLSLQYPPPRKSLCVKKVILLASIANFILDFSSFRYEIVNHDTFMVDLASVFQPQTHVQEDIKYSEEEEREICYEHLREQLTVLQVVKSYLYNENEENRKVLWDFIPLSLVFEKSLYGLVGPVEDDPDLHSLFVQHKILAFEIMRNLTAASSFFSEAIKETYLEYVKEEHDAGHTSAPLSWHEYLLRNLLSYNLFVDDDKTYSEQDFFHNDEFFFKLVKNTDYVRLLVGINYVEDHRYTNISVFKKSDFPSKPMINIWKRILDAKLSDKLEHKICGNNLNERVNLANQLIELKFSINWILINLTWQDDSFGYQVPDKVSFGLLDTVSHRTHSDPHNEDRQLFNSSNIVIEESEDDDEDEDDVHDHVSRADDDDAEMSAEDKAKLLHRYQFSSILQRIILDMSKPKYRTRGGSRASSMERFDYLNANNLYEKSKTAFSQITGLVSGNAAHEGSQGSGQRSEERHPLRRMSNIISSRDGTRVRRDVNRGGEGFGYDSADEVGNEEGGAGNVGVVDEHDEEEEEDDEEEDDNSNTNTDESDMGDVVDIDEYWVR
ncbi:hypothetical protein ACNR91_002427 [Candidozyma auris]